MPQPFSLVWDLDVFFPGGSSSAEFALFLERTETEVERLRQAVQTAADRGEAPGADALSGLVGLMQSITLMLREADSFAGCLAAENQHDKKAVQLNGQIASVGAAFASVLTRFDQLLRQIPDSVWSALLESESFRSIAFPLDERRQLAKEKLSPEQESLIGDLAVDGYHGWGEAYNTAVGKFSIAFEDNGETVQLSAGQAANKLHSPNRDVRMRLFAEWEKAWGDSADYAADALNRLAGFRIQTHKHRGWDSILKEPLDINRMSEKTLQVMWDVIDRNKAPFVAYLQRKADMFGLDALSWHDVDAPVGQAVKEVTFDEAAGMIVEQFRKFSPKMADFAEMAFENRWIEAEDRPGKRPGGFCTSFPIKGQTRIFMTYANTASNVATLAHELGHAYHQHVMNDMPALAQEYAMNVAETASTFAEMIVADAAVKQASSDEERLTLVEDKIQRSVAFFMNIHARFLFETEFYERRKKGLVGADELNELMTNAQKRAYKDALGEYHPHFWASKLHFYITGVPFYNFPYTFGYLFSSGIYAVAQREGSGFEDKYIALLRDTGSMTVEELARKHLGVDLTKPDFWQSAVDLAIEDVTQFLEMTK
ncbi:M3 family oligoendopeptidase [Paenibacillus hemerocallicola]|uniref:M3 family oligoendopeptidase n=1 Tax=Paenibacillus hemerocallicola TaxID=1172614 RepID=A0A5C4T6H4_9BACL|nr:M3 family oligoendopeptidase [Paenibacillus hemerocallicola]TNJ64658.1 M3 family oligoendopeptidase [Paenibacillus hemerocallicola]